MVSGGEIRVSGGSAVGACEHGWQGETLMYCGFNSFLKEFTQPNAIKHPGLGLFECLQP